MAVYNAGEKPKEFEYIYVVINDLSAIVHEIDSDHRKLLKSMLLTMNLKYCIRFILFEDITRYKAFTATICLYQVKFKQGVILTNNILSHILFDDEIQYSGNVRPPMAYVINGTIAQKGDCVEYKEK